MMAIIVAGGRGTRLSNLGAHIPKPLVCVAGRPLLDYVLCLLSRYGFQDVLLCTNYLSEQVESYVGDGNRWGLHVTYSVEQKPLGTAGCLRAIEPRPSEDFLVAYADVLIDMDLRALVTFHYAHGGDGTIVAHPNEHPFDSDLLELDPISKRVLAVHRKPHPLGQFFENLVNAGLYVFRPRVLDLVQPGEKADCAQDLFPRMLEGGYSLFAYRTAEYLKDLGTSERLAEGTRDILTGRVERSNRRYARPAVFIDRDGVINREVDLLHDPADFELLPGVVEAIRDLNRNGLLVIVVTNQPVVARGLCDEQTVRLIHSKMETLLGGGGAYVDGIYYCPHHPHSGYPGENPAYKVSCLCRKPETGLIKAAAADFHIDIANSVMVGDTTTDVQTGINAGLRTILVGTGYGGIDHKYDVRPDLYTNNFYTAVNWIIDYVDSVDKK
jgi:histidinol-phosphate phosphatase family protein